MIELARDAPNCPLVADVGLAEPAGGQSANARGRLDDHDGPAHAFYLDGGGDPRGGAAVDDDVVGWLGDCGRDRLANE